MVRRKHHKRLVISSGSAQNKKHQSGGCDWLPLFSFSSYAEVSDAVSWILQRCGLAPTLGESFTFSQRDLESGIYIPAEAGSGHFCIIKDSFWAKDIS